MKFRTEKMIKSDHIFITTWFILHLDFTTHQRSLCFYFLKKVKNLLSCVWTFSFQNECLHRFRKQVMKHLWAFLFWGVFCSAHRRILWLGHAHSAETRFGRDRKKKKTLIRNSLCINAQNHLILLTLQIRHTETCAAAAMKSNLIVILLALMNSPHFKLELLIIL